MSGVMYRNRVGGGIVGATASQPTGGGATGGMGFLDIASAVVGLLPVLTSFFKSVFGGQYQYSTGVRWLTQQYQYYVLGQANATGTHTSTGLNEQYTPEAQAWFSAVLGVPIYDRERLHALMGTNVADGRPLNNTDEQRVESYLRPAWTDTQAESRNRVMRAVQIAKQFRWGAAPGSWAKYGVPADQPEPTSDAGGGLFPGVSGGNNNLLLWGGLLLLGGALYWYYEGDA